MLLHRSLLAAGLGFVAGSKLAAVASRDLSYSKCQRALDNLWGLVGRHNDVANNITTLAPFVLLLLTQYDLGEGYEEFIPAFRTLARYDTNDTTAFFIDTGKPDPTGDAYTREMNIRHRNDTDNYTSYGRVRGECDYETGMGTIEGGFMNYDATSRNATLVRLRFLANNTSSLDSCGTNDDADDEDNTSCNLDDDDTDDNDTDGDNTDDDEDIDVDDTDEEDIDDLDFGAEGPDSDDQLIIRRIAKVFNHVDAMSGSMAREGKHNMYNLTIKSFGKDEETNDYAAQMEVDAKTCPPKSMDIRLQSQDSDSPLPSEVYMPNRGPLALLLEGLDEENAKNKTNSTLRFKTFDGFDNTFPPTKLHFRVDRKNGKPLPPDFFSDELDMCDLPLWDQDEKAAKKHERHRRWRLALWILGAIALGLLVLALLAYLLHALRKSKRNYNDPEKQQGLGRVGTSPSGTIAGSGQDDMGNRSAFNRGRPAGSTTGPTGTGTGGTSGTTGTGAAPAGGAGGQQERVTAAPGTERVVVQPAPASGTVAAP